MGAGFGLASRNNGPDGANVFPGRENSITSADGRVTVQVAGDAVADPGILTIAPVPGRDAGWDIDLEGADLVGEAVIRFAMDAAEAGEPDPTVLYREAGQEPQLATDVQLVAGEVVVRTRHFSQWWVIDWGEIKRGIVDAISRSVSISGDRAPTCEGEDEARERYAVDSDDGRRVYWCLGVEDDKTVLKAVNGRQYGVAAESTPGLHRTHLDTADAVGQLAKLLTPPATLPANTVDLLPSGDGIEYEVNGEQSRVGVKFQPEPGAYLLSALEYGISTYAMVLEASKIEGAEESLRTALVGASCLQDLTALMTNELGSVEEAQEFFQSALDASFSCVDDMVEDMDLGWILEGVVQPITWAVSGVKTAIMGFVAAGDLVLDVDGYQIIVDSNPMESDLEANSRADEATGESAPPVEDPAGSSSIGLTSFGGAFTQSDGYSYEVTYSGLTTAFVSNVLDQAPGEARVTLTVSGTAEMTNTTPQRNFWTNATGLVAAFPESSPLCDVHALDTVYSSGWGTDDPGYCAFKAGPPYGSGTGLGPGESGTQELWDEYSFVIAESDLARAEADASSPEFWAATAITKNSKEGRDYSCSVVGAGLIITSEGTPKKCQAPRP